VVNVIKESSYIKVDYPVGFPAIIPNLFECLMGISVGSVTVGTGTE
jgi:hypothetical protein